MNLLLEHTNEEERQILWHDGMSWHYFLDDPEGVRDRFEQHSTSDALDKNALPLGPEWSDAYAYWTGQDGEAQALLLLALHRAQGHRALLLWDLAQNGTQFGSWVVVSTLRWPGDPYTVEEHRERKAQFLRERSAIQQ